MSKRNSSFSDEFVFLNDSFISFFIACPPRRNRICLQNESTSKLDRY